MQEKLLLTTKNDVYVRVAIPTPLRKCFDYLPPHPNSNYQLQQGVRVQVPFGRQTLIGIIVAVTTKTDVSLPQLKKIIKIIDQTPLLPESLQKLLYWASKYYQYPLGLVFDAALTTPLRNGKILADYQQSYWQLTPKDNNNILLSTKAVKQRQLIELLARHPTGIAEYILNQQGFNKSIRNKLLEKKLIVTYKKDIYQTRVEQGHFINEQPLQLNPAQQLAVATIKKRFNTFQTFLLDGVTGSGKTEIYLQSIATILQQNKQVLLLLPEISLTPQTVARFKQRFSVAIVVFHSQLSEKERTVAWFKAKSGAAAIIIGTRSAAFLPLKNPGLFLIDEEHDQSFKQQDGFRYSARDLLIKRAQLENCPIILGSATPSLESLWNAMQNRYIHLTLPERAGLAVCPNIEVLDIRHKKLKQGLSLQLLEQIARHLANGGQVLIFLNRRGYAPVLMCSNCNWVQGCNSCDARMILHFYPKPRLICHHCQMSIVIPTVCPNCKANNLQPLGFGTEKLEHILQAHFPDVNIVRVDKDITRKKNALQNIIEQVESGHANILIGTQMLAKGHHFPNLSLVAIIDIDGALFSSDFRTIERMGQLITQVAGRAGRAQLPGSVILQTQHPEHPLLKQLLTEGYHALCQTLLKERKLSALPPFGYQILFKAASKYQTAALDFLLWLKKQANINKANKEIKLLGPIPAPIERKARSFRAQLLVLSSKRHFVHNMCEELITKIEQYPQLNQVHYAVDVDPLDFY